MPRRTNRPETNWQAFLMHGKRAERFASVSSKWSLLTHSSQHNPWSAEGTLRLSLRLALLTALP
jgi:hypothetical protein